jgi:acyl carrier protein
LPIKGLRKMSISDEVKQIIAAQVRGLDVSAISDNDTLENLGADSLDSVEIVLQIETTYKTTITESDFEKLHTVKDIVTFIEQL